MERRIATLVLPLVLTVGTGCAQEGAAPTSSSERPRNPAALVEGEPYRPEIDPANFVEVIDNPHLPLIPGTELSYEGLSDGERETEEFVVTEDTKEVMGVTTTIVLDRVYVGGELAEETYDWFAQDRAGNVWYFGEASADYEKGKVVSTKGSWEAGVDGALPGIVMLADPHVGNAYRQEFYAGEAEDTGTIIKLGQTVTVPYGTFEDVLVTEDRNPLEPGVLENKYYAPGIGVVYEELVSGGEGFLELVDFKAG
jgi:hypothetical protein